MARFFNTAGPVRCEDHYCLPPLERLVLPEVMTLIEQKKYFVLHAPRQTGKTSCLLALMEHLNGQGRFSCVYCNMEMGQAAREDVRKAMQTILNELASAALGYQDDPFPDAHWVEVLEKAGEHGALNTLLTLWASRSQRPLVLLIDEIDSLVGDTLISVLRQIRAGYHKRPRHFPQSIILCGVRDVRDYRIHSSAQKEIITGGSAFNIKAESLRLGDFTEKETTVLFSRHTEETGQEIMPQALQLIWELTHGQPWLVNALGYEACFAKESGRDRSQPVTVAMIEEAKERLIQKRVTHIDQLMDKLGEDRVKRVVGPILRAGELGRAVSLEDIQYVEDLGLVRRTADGIEIANPIYREVIPREMTVVTQINFAATTELAWYVLPDGGLDTDKLLAAFQEFFRENSEHWIERFEYREAGPQLLLQAFLQRVVNTGGRIEREYGLGRMRTDLLVIWPHPGGVQRIAIELKVLHRSLEQTLNAGLEQTWEYMDRCGGSEGHLVIFDRDAKKTWDEKIFRREKEHRGRRIVVWGM